MPEPDITELVRRNREAILPAAAHCGATNVRLIGSVARGEARAESDIDFFVTWRRAKGEGGEGAKAKAKGEGRRGQPDTTSWSIWSRWQSALPPWRIPRSRAHRPNKTPQAGVSFGWRWGEGGFQGVRKGVRGRVRQGARSGRSSLSIAGHRLLARTGRRGRPTGVACRTGGVGGDAATAAVAPTWTVQSERRNSRHRLNSSPGGGGSDGGSGKGRGALQIVVRLAGWPADEPEETNKCGNRRRCQSCLPLWSNSPTGRFRLFE